MKRQLVPRTRNGGTWTEAAYWSRVANALRKAFAAWVPMREALKSARRASQRTDRPLLKYEYQCVFCKAWFPLNDEGPDGKKLVQVDHKIAAGSLRTYDAIGPWLQRLTDENPAMYQIVCKPCHQEKTNVENAARRNAQ